MKVKRSESCRKQLSERKPAQRSFVLLWVTVIVERRGVREEDEEKGRGLCLVFARV